MSFNLIRKLDKAHQATHIHNLRHGEAEALAGEELARFIEVLESLEPEEWTCPTAFSSWEVHRVAAHVSGTIAALASWGEFKHPHEPLHLLPEALHLRNLLNHTEGQEDAGETPEQVREKLRQANPEAFKTIQKLPLPLRALPVPMGGGGLQVVTLGHLTGFLFTADIWLHRLDICLATGHEMVQTSTHDGHLLELLLRDLAHNRKLEHELGETAVALALSGPAGGWWWFGHNTESHTPAATVRMLALDFLRLISGRLPVSDALALPGVYLEGDPGIARRFLNNTALPL